MITYIYKFLYVNLRGPKKKWFLRSILQEGADFTLRLSDCKELVGKVNHITGCSNKSCSCFYMPYF